jgi:hypothetical protein
MSITKCAEHPALKTSRLPFFADKFDVTRIHSIACPQFRTKTHPTPPPGKGLNSGMHIEVNWLLSIVYNFDGVSKE